MPSIALLGGSFNPPHVAHQMAALWALSCAGMDQVWLMPCYRHPFGKELVHFPRRVEMCQLACAPLAAERVTVTTVEAEDPDETRTLFTLRLLQARHPEHRFALLMGADILAEKESWYRFNEIEQMADVLVLGRGGYPAVPGAPTLPDISSREVRRRLAAEEDISGLVPDEVRQYISYHSLYRSEG